MAAPIEQQIYAQLSLERGPIEFSFVNEDREEWSDEWDARTWHVAYGMAWALIRSAEPFATDDEVGQRSVDAADWAQRAHNTVGGMAALSEAP